MKVDLPLSKEHVRQLLIAINCARDEAGAYEDSEYEDLRNIILGLGGYTEKIWAQERNQ